MEMLLVELDFFFLMYVRFKMWPREFNCLISHCILLLAKESGPLPKKFERFGTYMKLRGDGSFF